MLTAVSGCFKNHRWLQYISLIDVQLPWITNSCLIDDKITQSCFGHVCSLDKLPGCRNVHKPATLTEPAVTCTATPYRVFFYIVTHSICLPLDPQPACSCLQLSSSRRTGISRYRRLRVIPSPACATYAVTCTQTNTFHSVFLLVILLLPACGIQ